MRLGAKRYISIGREKQKSVVRWLCALFVFGAFAAVFLYGVSVLHPAFCALADNRARELAVVTIHETVASHFAKEEYQDLVRLEKGEENEIAAVQSDMARLGKLKAELSVAVQNALSSVEKSTLSVPLGSMSGSALFYGMGPDISFRVKPYGNVLCDVSTNFIESGINQTMCSVDILVKAEMGILMPLARKTSVVETTVPVAQTILVGDVPQSYTNVDREGKGFEDDVLQLAE